MKRQFLISSLIIVTLAGILMSIAGKATAQHEANMLARSQMEASILHSTVRFHIQSWVVKDGEAGYLLYDSVGHGTVMEGRYLVTHNHIEIPLSIRPRAGDPETYGMITLFNAAGTKVHVGPLAEFELARAETETLVFAAKEEGFFETLGFSSANFKQYSSVELKPGMEVGQVDWDGQLTRVDWTTVREVVLDDGLARLVLDDGAMVGASGGGIFYQGDHVANNWRLEERVDGNGEVVEAVTTVALNTAEVIGS